MVRASSQKAMQVDQQKEATVAPKKGRRASVAPKGW